VKQGTLEVWGAAVFEIDDKALVLSSGRVARCWLRADCPARKRRRPTVRLCRIWGLCFQERPRWASMHVPYERWCKPAAFTRTQRDNREYSCGRPCSGRRGTGLAEWRAARDVLRNTEADLEAARDSLAASTWNAGNYARHARSHARRLAIKLAGSATAQGERAAPAPIWPSIDWNEGYAGGTRGYGKVAGDHAADGDRQGEDKHLAPVWTQ